MKKPVKLLYNIIIWISYILTVVFSIILGLYLLYYYPKTSLTMAGAIGFFFLAIFTATNGIRIIKINLKKKHKHKKH